MRAKQLGLYLAGLLFLLACSLLQSPASTPSHSPTASDPPTPGQALTPTATASGEVTTAPEVVYELFDESPAPDRFSVVRVGKSKEALADVLRMEAKKAADLGRHPYAEFYADWCPPCKAIQKSLGDRQMIDAFTGTYIVRLDLDYWKPRLSKTGFYVPGIPAFYELDTDGKPTGRMITGAAWGDDIPENIAPPMKRFFNGD